MNVLFRRLLLAGLAAAVLSTVAAAQSAQKAQGDRPLLGPHAGFATNDLDFAIGAQFAYPVANRFDIYPSFDFYFPGNHLTVFALEGDVRYWPKLNMKDPGLYLGAGLNYTHAKFSFQGVEASSSDVGLGLLGGWDFKQVSWRPFAQIRIVIGDADRLEFGGGVNFKL